MKGRECELARRIGDWLSNDEEQLKFVFGHEVQDEDLEEVQRASGQVVKGLIQLKHKYQNAAGVCLWPLHQPCQLLIRNRPHRGFWWPRGVHRKSSEGQAVPYVGEEVFIFYVHKETTFKSQKSMIGVNEGDLRSRWRTEVSQVGDGWEDGEKASALFSLQGWNQGASPWYRFLAKICEVKKFQNSCNLILKYIPIGCI